MKNKSTLLLMEQLIMVLVFALATALCLRVFVKADEISLQTARQDRAVLLAQNAAEQLKSGVPEEKIPCEAPYTLEIDREDSGVPGLAQACIRVRHPEEQDVLFTLTTGWLEVTP